MEPLIRFAAALGSIDAVCGEPFENTQEMQTHVQRPTRRSVGRFTTKLAGSKEDILSHRNSGSFLLSMTQVGHFSASTDVMPERMAEPHDRSNVQVVDVAPKTVVTSGSSVASKENMRSNRCRAPLPRRCA